MRRWMKEVRDILHPIEYAALLQRGYLPAVIPPALRGDYMGLLEQARREDGPLVAFLAEREIETQKQLLWLLDGPVPEEGPQLKLE